MKIIVVLVGNINKFPPTISLLNVLEDLEIQTVLVTTRTSYKPNNKFISLDEIDIDYESKSPAEKMMLIHHLSKLLWGKIEKHYTDDSVIWVVTDVTVKYLGYRLIGKRYVLQFLELLEKLVYYKKMPWLSLDAKKLCDSAIQVVVPEYNRAHILHGLWNINKMPVVVSNCPYNHETIEKNSTVDDEIAKRILYKIGNKKIILYQGVIGKERPLEPMIRAVSSLGDEYAFVVMSGGKNIYQNLGSRNYFFIPFVSPPGHLQITSHAHIGVLSYVPAKETGYSVLNTLYCAPNKIFEFAQFGIPMIGNDNPGLKYLFKTEHIGEIFTDWSEDAICNAIKRIEEDYEEYEKAGRDFINGVDVRGQIEAIINDFGIFNEKSFNEGN